MFRLVVAFLLDVTTIEYKAEMCCRNFVDKQRRFSAPQTDEDSSMFNCLFSWHILWNHLWVCCRFRNGYSKAKLEHKILCTLLQRKNGKMCIIMIFSYSLHTANNTQNILPWIFVLYHVVYSTYINLIHIIIIIIRKLI